MAALVHHELLLRQVAGCVLCAFAQGAHLVVLHTPPTKQQEKKIKDRLRELANSKHEENVQLGESTELVTSARVTADLHGDSQDNREWIDRGVGFDGT